MIGWAWMATWWACGGPESPPSPDGGPGPIDVDTSTRDTATPGSETADTGEPPTVPATVITADCAPTDNVLRFDCTVTIAPPQAVEVRFGPADGSGPERIHTSDEALGTHDIGLYLMRPDTDYVWTARPTAGTDDVEASGMVTTGLLPHTLENAHLVVSGISSVPYVGTHLPCNGTATAVVYDTVTGEIVWYHELDDSGTIGFFDMIQYTEDHTVLAETSPSLVEVDLRGRDLLRLHRNVDYDAYFHHDLFKRDGYIYAIFQDATGAPILDGITIFDATTGAVVAEWRAREHFAIPPDAVGDWMHTNTVWVDEDGFIYLSSWAQDTILKIAGDWAKEDFGTPIWAMAGAGPAGFGQDFDIDFAGLGLNFYNQHNVNFTPDGRLLMLDNGNGRALLMTVDQAARTARADAAFPAQETVCGPQGTAATVTSGNLFVGCSGSMLLEYDPTGLQVWSAQALCEDGRTSSIRWYPLEDW